LIAEDAGQRTGLCVSPRASARSISGETWPSARCHRRWPPRLRSTCMKTRKTDYGTIILHWLLVATFGIAFVTGLRIATEAPGRSWINFFDAVLPRESVWMAHMQAAVALVVVALAYAIYVVRSGLGRRIRLDKIRV